MNIRWTQARDIPAMTRISQTDYSRVLKQRNAVSYVAEVDGVVAGFLVYAIHPDRLHVLAVHVDNKYRRQGVGTALVKKARERLVRGRRQIVVEVEESNLDAQLWLRACGFRATSILHNFYWDCDGIVFRWEREEMAPLEAFAREARRLMKHGA